MIEGYIPDTLAGESLGEGVGPSGDPGSKARESTPLPTQPILDQKHPVYIIPEKNLPQKMPGSQSAVHMFLFTL